jgi:type II secretory pathway component GspD/PulD (secretin)
MVRPALADSGTTYKVYPCPAGTAQSVADRLWNEYGVIAGVRIAAEPQTSQVVVQAPPEVQARISQRLAGTAGQSAPPAAAVAANPDAPGRIPAGAPAGGVQSRSVSLRRLSAEQLEARLWGMLGNRLSATPGGSREIRRYRLALASGGAVMLTLDAANQRMVVDGSAAAADACVRLVQYLDSPAQDGQHSTQMVPLEGGRPEDVRRAAQSIMKAMGPGNERLPMALALFQGPPGQADAAGPAQIAAAPAGAAPPPPAGAAPPAPAQPGMNAAEAAKALTGLVNPVTIDVLPGLDILVIRGAKADVEQTIAIIKQIERLSVETEPAIEVRLLKYVDCQTLAMVLRSLYDEVFLARQGSISITPLVKPNALFLVGRKENVARAIGLIDRLDQPVDPESQFRVFPLKHAAAATAQSTLLQVYADRGGLGPVVRVTADVRSNSLIVQASLRDMEEVATVVSRIDVSTSPAVDEVRIIPLEHTLAQDVATVIQSAIGAAGGGRQGAAPGAQMGPNGMPQQPAATPGAQQRSVMLRFMTYDAKGKQLLNLSSGILDEVRISPDTTANALVVSAPAESLELLEALIRQLDRLPAAEAQIKVFTIVNGDAATMVATLQTLFFAQANQPGQPGQGGMGMGAGMGAAARPPVSGVGENLTVPLRFASDTRTNSIIASGAMGDLNVVEAILTRLDDSDAGHRKSHVFRLKNSPAADIATAIGTFLRSQTQTQPTAPGLVSPFEQIEHEVIVVPEPVSNSLILSATPRYFEEVRKLIEDLDARPPLVTIQVLIAQITLGSTNEFGMELGLQDSLLFDRSILNNIQYITSTTTNAITSTTNQSIVSATNQPGFQFTTQPPGNSGASTALANAANVGGQGITNLGVGYSNPTLGYSGLVLSASSENVSFLLRALAENHRVDVLQRPQITTLDNQAAFVQVGQRVPQISGTAISQVGQTNTINLVNVGLILGVTPRVSPDGLVVMQIDAEKSELEDINSGIPVSISGGQVIRSPIIDTTTAQTTISAMSGQTVILGGLISTSNSEIHHKVPWLGDLPLLGSFFRFDGTTKQREELLIIMTPHIVRNESDMEAIKQVEAARMSWCISDVTAMYGEAGLRKRTDVWSDDEVPTIYPDGGGPPAAPAPKFEGRPVAPESLPPAPGVPTQFGPTSQMNNSNSLEQPAALPPDAPRGILSPMAAQPAGYPAAPQPAAVQPATYDQPGAPASGAVPSGFMPGGFAPGGPAPQPYPGAPPPPPQRPWYPN